MVLGFMVAEQLIVSSMLPWYVYPSGIVSTVNFKGGAENILDCLSQLTVVYDLNFFFLPIQQTFFSQSFIFYIAI